VDVARQILKSHKWGMDEYDTFVVFHTFDSSSINTVANGTMKATPLKTPVNT